MSNSNKVSVVIPVYNSEKFLKESIESILTQTYKNIEVFAIDDGSTDNSLQILRKYDKQIIVSSQKNQGLATTLNTAIKKINGNWLKWLSPDDVLYPNAIETLVNESKKFSENTIIYSNWEIIDENSKKIRDFSEKNYNDLDLFEFNVRLLDGQQINVNTTLIPRSLFERGCILRELEDPVAIDYDFFLRAGILYDTPFRLIPISLLKYRIHQNQLSHSNIASTLKYLSNIKNEVLSMFEKQTRESYLIALKDYRKNKPIRRKTMELLLEISTRVLPDKVTNRGLLFYLNKIRSTR